MEFKHIRGNFLIIFEKVTEIPLLILGIVFSAFILKNFDEQGLVPVVIILLSPISKLIDYLFTFYTLTDNHLIIESGVFTKKKTEIPFSMITTVDLSQNLLFQLLKVYKIKVDNASQTNDAANKSNVNLTLKLEEAIKFKQIITKMQETEIVQVQKKDSIKAGAQDFIKLGLLQSKFVYFLSIMAVAGPVSGIIIKKFEKVVESTFIGGVIFVAIIIIYLITIGMSVIKSVITYYNFEILAEEETLKVEYGFLDKKKFSFQKSKINGIILKQSILMRLFKLYTAEVIVIGYGDSSKDGGKEQAIIFPIASMERLKGILNKVLPEYSLDYTLCKPEKKAVRYFFFSPGFLLAAISSVVLVIISIIAEVYIIITAAVVLLAVFTYGAILRYKNAGICVGKNNVVLSAGGYNKRVAIIRTKSIESITASGSIFKRKKEVVSIKLGFVAPLRVSNITSQNLPVSQFDLLEGVMTY